MSGFRLAPEGHSIWLGCPLPPDDDLHSAVCDAIYMMRVGTPPPVANALAADYRCVSTSDVAHYTGLHAERIKGFRK